MSRLSNDEIAELGFHTVGKNVQISRRAAFHNPQNISLGDNVRIDDFCVLSAGAGGIRIGSYIHVAVYSSLIGAAEIVISDFCNLSSRVSIYSSSDDYSGESLTNPLVPEKYKRVTHANVHLGKHVIIGSGCVLLPGVTLHEGAAVGALSLVTRDCDSFGVYAGVPARRIKERKRDIIALERQLLSEQGVQ